jgi:hypothetical protein
MSAEAARRAPLITLQDLIVRYRHLVHAFGDPAALSAFGFSDSDTERLFSAYDEDYHISRFFDFSESEGQRFSINGVPATHVAFSPEIETIL